MSDIRINIAQMRDSATTLSSSAASITDSMNVIDSNMKALGPDRYVSPSADRLRDAYARLYPTLMDVPDLLRRFENELRTAADAFERAV
jgi:uncharacterized protein YukE